MPVTFGLPMSFEVALSSYSLADNGTAFSDGAHTALWGGLAVYDDALRPMAFTADSDVGIDLTST
jgi:hypothetical protein